MQSEQKKEFLLTVAYYAVLAAALYLFLRYLLWWLLPFLLAFAAARAMEPVILFLRRTVHFKRGFSAALLTLFLLFLLRLLFTFGEPCRYPVRFLRFLEKISMGSIHK